MTMESSFVIALSLVAAVIACIYVYLSSFLNYWKDRGIPHIKPTIFLKCMKDLVLGRTTMFEIQMKYYNSLSGQIYGGFHEFTKPCLMVRDPELIERVLIKDFNYFMDRGIPSATEEDIFTLNLANAEGERWRALRYKLTPTFTSGKLKGMFEQMNRACDDLIRYIDDEGSKGDGQLEGKPLCNRYGMNVIATCAFGIEFSYHDKERDRFLKMVQKVVTPTISQILRHVALLYFPSVFRRLGICVLDGEVTDYFVGLVEEAFRCRKVSKSRRNDFLQLLLDLKENEDSGVSARNEDNADYDPEDAIINQMHHVSSEDEKSEEKSKLFSIKSIAGQAMVFLLGGAEAPAGTMNFFLFSMATHPEIQSKLRKEVDQALQKYGQWSCEMLKSMTYIDQVIQETMRVYPINVFLKRKCTKPYRLPDSDVVIEPGTIIVIPAYSLQYDPQYYPDPQKFDPDRWTERNYKESGRFLPFGDGPRICIALRYAVLQMKICLARLIAEYNVKMGPKTHVPLQFVPRAIKLVPKGGIWLQFEKRPIKSKSESAAF